jgi:hypothetical protein
VDIARVVGPSNAGTRNPLHDPDEVSDVSAWAVSARFPVALNQGGGTDGVNEVSAWAASPLKVVWIGIELCQPSCKLRESVHHGQVIWRVALFELRMSLAGMEVGGKVTLAAAAPW